jgi:hypothetical protein
MSSEKSRSVVFSPRHPNLLIQRMNNVKINIFTFNFTGAYAAVTSVPGLPALELVISGYFMAVGTVLPFVIIFGCNI